MINITSLVHQFPRYYLTNHVKSLVRNREGIIKGSNCYESFDRRFSCHLFDWKLGLIGSFIDYPVELQGTYSVAGWYSQLDLAAPILLVLQVKIINKRNL